MVPSSVVILIVFLLLKATSAADADELRQDYYAQTCPQVEEIIQNATRLKLERAPTTAAAVTRLLFHDCFVEGCDASVMITSTPDNVAERDAEINMDLAGDAFDAIVQAKAAIEATCPRVVSCADILALVTRDLIALTGGPSYPVLKGRKDGLVSKASRVKKLIPDATLHVRQLSRNFRRFGLNMEDMVVLSGAHTFGFSHCTHFKQRLYNFSREQPMDPKIPPNFASSLKSACPLEGGDRDLVLPFDPTTPFSFDNSYYKTLVDGNALLESDVTLLSRRRTRNLVQEFARDQELFFQKFAAAMQKMSSIGVKSSRNGNVRIDCTAFNK